MERRVRDQRAIMRGRKQNTPMRRGTRRVQLHVMVHPLILERARLLPIPASLSSIAEGAFELAIRDEVLAIKKECVWLRDKELAFRDGLNEWWPVTGGGRIDWEGMQAKDPELYKYAQEQAEVKAKQLFKGRLERARKLEEHVRKLGLWELYESADGGL